MGIITLALISLHMWNKPGVPDWVKLVCAVAMGLGTATGGYRIIHTMGSKITKLQPVGGFAAETGAAMALLTATLAGVPVGPPRFTGIARQPGGGVLLSIQGQSNISYTVLGSTNLAQWTPVTNVTAGPDGMLQILQSSTNLARRFFRLRYP